MDIGDFITVFKDGGVRAWLDWDALEDAGCAVREQFSRSPDVLGGLFTVWYQTADGTDGDWRNPGDRPLRVAECADAMDIWPADRRDRIHGFADAFRGDDRPVQLVLPAYAVGGDGAVLLDGTHRAVAAHLSGADVRIMLFVLDGPLDPRVLPDLGHHR